MDGVWIDVCAALPQVSKPARYINNEINAVHKEWDNIQVKIALAFPDIYEVGMGHLGFKILYSIINGDRMLWQNAYTPWVDLEEKDAEAKIPLTTLESGRVEGLSFSGLYSSTRTELFQYSKHVVFIGHTLV